MLLLILFILGGIYAGIFTPTEAGAMGAFGAIIICFAIRRLNKSQFKDALVDTIKSSTMIIFMLIGAFIFMRFVTVSRIPNMLSEFIVGIQAPISYNSGDYRRLYSLGLFYGCACNCSPYRTHNFPDRISFRLQPDLVGSNNGKSNRNWYDYSAIWHEPFCLIENNQCFCWNFIQRYSSIRDR